MIFGDEDRKGAHVADENCGSEAKLRVSSEAVSEQTMYGLPVHRSSTLLSCMATLTRNRVRLGEQSFEMLATAADVEERALQLLQVRRGRPQCATA